MKNLKAMTVEELEQERDKFQAKIDGGSTAPADWMCIVEHIEDELALRSLE